MILAATAFVDLKTCADLWIYDQRAKLSFVLDVGRIYKVFDLKNYNFLYQISDNNVQEIKIRFTSISFFL